MSQTATDRKRPANGFTGNPRRKVIPVAPGDKSPAELIAEFLKTNVVTICPPRHADGSVQESGSYKF